MGTVKTWALLMEMSSYAPFPRSNRVHNPPFLATDKQLMATMAIEKGELWTRSKRGTSAQFHFFISGTHVLTVSITPWR